MTLNSDVFIFNPSTDNVIGEAGENGLYYPCGLPFEETEKDVDHLAEPMDGTEYVTAPDVEENGIYYPCGLPVVEEVI